MHDRFLTSYNVSCLKIVKSEAFVRHFDTLVDGETYTLGPKIKQVSLIAYESTTMKYVMCITHTLCQEPFLDVATRSQLELEDRPPKKKRLQEQ